MRKRLEDTKGVFCMETHEWFGIDEMEGVDNSSVEPSLLLLEKLADYNVPYRRLDVATREEFEYFLDSYLTDTYDDFPILYLAFHGRGPRRDGIAGITLGNGDSYSLDDLEAKINGRCKGRIIHFGACGIMSESPERLRSFIANSRALALCGYTEDVDWLESAAFDLLLLGYLQWAAFTQRSLRKVERDLRKTASGLCVKLGFRTEFGHG